MSMNRKAIIAGAGPAGLTAAYELITRTNIKPVVYEMTDDIGGISKTVNYKGNRIDIGGHRFFSKSIRVMNWWQSILPIEDSFSRNGVDRVEGVDEHGSNNVMLVRSRYSRIYFLGKFFNYPVTLNLTTIRNLGLYRILKIGLSYLNIKIRPVKIEKNLEDFFINRFGKELYLIFFKDYTEKVWGAPCNQIKPDWGAQRVKGLSLRKVVTNFISKLVLNDNSIDQKKTETTLIEKFLYPKFGPGQMWETVADLIKQNGGEIHKNCKIVGMELSNKKVLNVEVLNTKTQQTTKIEGDYFLSTMPVKNLIESFSDSVPNDVKNIADGLKYRDFITVGLLLKELEIKNRSEIKTKNDLIPDNWIYIQERDVKVGRLQIFNNWSPYMVKDRKNVWLGMEYFCNEGDELWSKTDEELVAFAITELEKIGIVKEDSVLDSTVIKMPKTYPVYFGTYDRFDAIRKFTDTISNLFLIGRNGMHRYNNMDHSMLAAMTAVDNIINNVKTKDNIWNINTEKEYHEGN